MMNKMTLSAASVLALLATTAASSWATPIISGGPGDTGTFEVDVTNEVDSGGPQRGAKLQVLVPAQVSTTSMANAGPFDIPVGETRNTSFDYSIATSAPTGLYRLKATVVSSNTVVDTANPMRTYSAILAVLRDITPPLLEPDIAGSTATGSGQGPWNISAGALAIDPGGIQTVQLWHEDTYNKVSTQYTDTTPTLVSTQSLNGATQLGTPFQFSYLPADYSNSQQDDYALLAVDNTGNVTSSVTFSLTAMMGGVGIALDNGSNPVALSTISAVVDTRSPQYGTIGSVFTTDPPGFSGNVFVAPNVAYIEGGQPQSESIPFATVSISVKTGNDPSQLQTLSAGQIVVSVLNNGAATTIVTSSSTFIGGQALKRYYAVQMDIAYAGGEVLSHVDYTCPNGLPYGYGNLCGNPISHYMYFPAGSLYFGNVGAGFNAYAITMAAFQMLNTANGQNVAVPTQNSEVVFSDVKYGGHTRVALVPNNNSTLGNTIPPNQAFQAWTSANVDGQTQLTVYYGGLMPPTVTPTQEAGLTLTQINGSSPGPVNATVDPVSHRINASIPFTGTGDMGTFAIVIPTDTSKPGIVQNFSAVEQADNSFALSFTASGSDGQSVGNSAFQVDVTQNGTPYSSTSIDAQDPGQTQQYNTGPLPVGNYQFSVSGIGLSGTIGQPAFQSGSVTGQFGGGPQMPSGASEATLSATQAASVTPIIPQDPQYVAVQAALKGAGKINITNAYRIGSSLGAFQNPATLTLNYPAMYDSYNQNSFSVYIASSDGTLSRPPQTINLAAHTASVRISTASGTYVFAFDAPPSSYDSTPPVTTIAFTPPAISTTSGITLAPGTAISFFGTDPAPSSGAASGYAYTYYWVDVPSGSTATILATQYSSSFTLATGTHTITYFGVDFAGNQESPQSVALTVLPSSATGSGSSGSGRTISLDAVGQLWEVVASTDGSSLSLSRFTPDGTTLLSSAPLPQATQKVNWSVQFDAVGNAYAVGGANPPTGGTDLAIYQVSPQGVLLSSAGFHSGIPSNSLDLDATNGVWITGALQTGSLKNGTAQAQLALWRFNPANGSVSLAATYSRGNGGDLGFGVRISSSIVWVAGYSAATNAGLGGSMDLALWGFDPSSAALVRGPFFVPGVLSNGLPDNFGAKLDAVGGNLYVAGTRQSSATAQAGFYEFDSSGHLLLSRSWTPASGLTSQVNAIVHDSSGHLAAAGQVGNSGASTLAVWTYGQDGTFAGAFTDPSAPGGATGVVLSSTAFLSLGSSGSPYPFQFKTPLGGTDTLLGSGPTDVLPPRTTLKIGAPQTGASPVFVSTTTPLSLSSVDDLTTVGDGMGLGVAQSFVAVDSGSFVVYTGTFTLAAPGLHQIRFYSVDKVGNTEIVRSTQVAVDVLPPRTAVAFGQPEFLSAEPYLTSASSITFSAVDDLAVVGDGAGAGVAQTLVALDSGAFVPVATSTTITAEGLHTLSWFSRDALGNAEVVHSTSVAVDDTPPVTSISISTPQVQQSSGVIVGPSTVLALLSQDPEVGGAASGVRQTYVAVATSAFSAYASNFSLSGVDDARTIQFYSLDNVGNVEVAKSMSVLFDATPPQTTDLLVGGTTYPAAAGVYVSSAARVVLSAFDPLVNGIASGLAFTRWQDNGGAFQIYASSLAFAEGGHVLGFQSQDNVANLEVLRSTTILVDATPPVTTVAVGASSFTSVAGTLYVTPVTPVTLSAADPALPQLSSSPAAPGSGVAQILVSVDSGAFTVYASSLTFAEGAHTLAYRSIDNVGNAEALRVLALQSDATPPQTALAVSSPIYQGYVSSATIFALSAVDPVVNGVASGVAATRYQINGGVFLSTPLAFGLTGPDGAYVLRYQSVDNVENTEVLRSTAVRLDQTSPLTQLLVLGGRQFQGSAGFYASPDTRLVLVSSDPVVNGVASGLAWTRWQDNGGAFQLYASSLAFTEGSHALGYQSQDNVANLEVLRSTTVLIDATPPVTTVAVGSPTYTAPDGTLYVATTTPVSFAAADPALASSTVAGSGVNHIEVSVDSAPFAPYTAALTFAEGAHVVLYRAIDNVGNVETAHSLALRSDATPPVSSLVVGSPQFALSSATVLVSSLTPLGVAAVDPVSNGVASGVRQSFYAVGGGSFAVFTASFTLTPPDGPWNIAYYSQDHVLNTENVKAGTVVLDATPPVVALLSPGGCSGGVCRVVKGKFPVLGTATDLHFASYRLEFSPGQNATTGYALINSGTVAVSSSDLGTWDASALSGWQTLRLTATDLVANVSVATVNVFVGDPGELMILGNHDVFNMPQGVAADASGNVYVADTNADQIAVFSATGAFVTAYGQSDDDRVSSTTIQLNKPKGVAVDAAGNIFIADTNENRVLKLSATGQVLLTLGRQAKPDKDHEGALEFQPGKGLGEFNKPSGVALDAAGNIYVSDTNNDRVQIFSSTGAPLLAFSLPPLPKVHDDEKADHDDDQPTLGRPFGVAVDAVGRIYVADPYGSRALVFGATGQLLLTLPIAGTTKDGHVLPGRPEGVAVSTDGYCLLVSDRKFDRVLKFDGSGDATLIFGAPGHYDDRKQAGIVFHKPVGLALSADGTLLVADRNNDRVERFGLPTGKTLVVPPSTGDDPYELAQDVLDSDAGGTVERADKAGVTIPPGALPDDLKITVSTLSASGAAQGGAMDQVANAKGLAPAYAPVQYGPEGTQFNVPVTLVEPYDPNLVAASGMSEDSLAIHYWNPAKNDWEALASTVDKSAHTVTAKTPHFSLYQVLGSTGTGVLKPLASADPTFTFHAGYAFPNPVRGTSVVTIRIQPGLADSVSVNVYDISGRRVHSSSDFKQNILDDGNGLGFQYTFDHVWDISGVGSGVYMYVITAHKAGMSDIHKSGKIGLVK